MERANIDDRESLRAAYPFSAYEQDALHNAVGSVQTLRGVRIDSGIDGAGWFPLIRAQHHVGEAAPAGGAAFLAPDDAPVAANLVGAEADDGAPHGDALAQRRRRDYETFIDRIAEAARNAPAPGAIGRGEERLSGFRGG